jgi:hypothetical protein
VTTGILFLVMDVHLLVKLKNAVTENAFVERHVIVVQQIVEVAVEMELVTMVKHVQHVLEIVHVLEETFARAECVLLLV